MALPFTTPAVWPELIPSRFASSFQRAPEGCQLALLGLADDLGVSLNGGRAGARQGPAAFRAALSRFGVAWDGGRQRPLHAVVYDAGDVTPAPGGDTDALFETHERVRVAVEALQRQGLVTICIGGGHDLSLPAIAGVSEALGAPLGGVNLDAHLDVRERIGSGMPFRRLIEGGRLTGRRFVELGLGRFVNDAADLAWLGAQGATAVHAEVIAERGLDSAAALEVAAAEGPAFLSVDLDVLDQSVAPGVSAPNPLGLGLQAAAQLCEAAGARREIRHFDLMELNPAFDLDGHTARVAALLFLQFVAGFCQRLP